MEFYGMGSVRFVDNSTLYFNSSEQSGGSVPLACSPPSSNTASPAGPLSPASPAFNNNDSLPSTLPVDSLVVSGSFTNGSYEHEAAAFLVDLSAIVLARGDWVPRPSPKPTKRTMKSSTFQVYVSPMGSRSDSRSRSASPTPSSDSSSSGSGSSRRAPPKSTKPKENHTCPNCGTTESTLWRNCTINGKIQYLCNACGLRFKKGKYCPLCYKVYYDMNTNSADWKQCSSCFNWTHKQCLTEKRPDLLASAETAKYLCNHCSPADFEPSS